MNGLGFFTLADIDPRLARVERELDAAAGSRRAPARAARADEAPDRTASEVTSNVRGGE